MNFLPARKNLYVARNARTLIGAIALPTLGPTDTLKYLGHSFMGTKPPSSSAPKEALQGLEKVPLNPYQKLDFSIIRIRNIEL